MFHMAKELNTGDCSSMHAHCLQHSSRAPAYRATCIPAGPHNVSRNLNCILQLYKSRQSVICDSYRFVVYTKPDCPLCEGLKGKLEALIDRAQFMPSMLSGAELEVRDISTNEVWCEAHAGSIPVLAVLTGNEQEVILPRPAPRITADRLQRHLEEALADIPAE